MDMSELHVAKNLALALLFSVVGMTVLIGSFLIFDKLTPGNLWKQIIEEKNQAVAVFMGAFLIALSIIIASAIKG